MQRYWDSPVARMSLTYLLCAFGLTALAFYVVYPASGELLGHIVVNPYSTLYSFLHDIPQDLVYFVDVLAFYNLVVRPFKLRPLLGEAHGTLRFIVLWVCIGVTYVCLTPFNLVFTVLMFQGMLTFMITGLSEEWVFRGVITRVLKDRLGIIWGVVLSSTLFAVFHWCSILIAGMSLVSVTSLQVIGRDFLIGVIFGIVAWRSRSILWIGFLHCMFDLHPYEEPGRHWMLVLHVPWLGVGTLQILLIGIVGAEIIRRYSQLGGTPANPSHALTSPHG